MCSLIMEGLMSMQVSQFTITCQRCGHVWAPRKPEVRACPKCRSYWFDIPKLASVIPVKPGPIQAKPQPKPATKSKPLVVPSKPDEVTQDTWEAFKVLRVAKKAPLSELALTGLERESKKAGISLEEAMSMCITQGWQGFQARYINKDKPASKSMYQHNGLDQIDYGPGGVYKL